MLIFYAKLQGQAEEAAIRETREEFGINIANIIPITTVSDMPAEYCPSQVFLCTEYYGNPICFNNEMENARFEDVRNIADMDLFLPFRLSLETFLGQLINLNDNEYNSDDWKTINGQHINISENGEVISGNPKVLEKSKDKKKQNTTEKTVDFRAAREYTERLKGITTVKGTKIKSVSGHAAYRMNERKISTDDLKDALTGAGITYPGNSKHKDVECYQYKQMRIVVSPEGKIVTAINLEAN